MKALYLLRRIMSQWNYDLRNCKETVNQSHLKGVKLIIVTWLIQIIKTFPIIQLKKWLKFWRFLKTVLKVNNKTSMNNRINKLMTDLMRLEKKINKTNLNFQFSQPMRAILRDRKKIEMIINLKVLLVWKGKLLNYKDKLKKIIKKINRLLKSKN